MSSSQNISFDVIARDKASSTFNKISGSTSRLEKNSRHLGSSLGRTGGTLAKFGKFAAVGLGAATVAGAVFLAKVGGPYVASLNKIQTLTGSSNETMKQVAKTLEGNASLYAKMGQTTGDAAGGVVELTKAGQTLGNAMKSVNATMVLAKAGEMGVADASSLVANTLNTFGMKAKSAGNIANFLANAANISSADVSDLAESLKYVAPVAASTGVSLKLTSAILAELSNSGIDASNAGTGFRKFLLSLQAPSGAAAKDLKALNVEIFDAAGKMKPLPAVIDSLNTAMSGLADEKRQKILKDIFGLQGVSAAQVILKNGTDGLAKYAKGVGKAGAAQALANSASKGLMGTLGMLKAEIVSLGQSVYRKLSPAIDGVLRPFVAKFGELATNAGPAIGGFLRKLAPVAGKVKAAFGSVDLSGLGSKMAKQAQGWAAPIIGGFKTGLDSGDWSGLGKALGNGIVRAIEGLGALVGKIGDTLGKMMSKVDWVGIGIAMGKQAPSLVIGLAAGILNFDLMGLLGGLAKHWQDVLLAVLAVAFTPGRIVGKVGELLAHIPLVGKLLEWALLHFKGFADGLKNMVWTALKFLGREFMTGFRKVFPTVGKAFGEALKILPTRLGLIALELQAKGIRMVLGLGRAIGSGFGAVARAIGQLIAVIIRPWAEAASWLIGKGTAIVRGLLSGIKSKAGEVFAFFKGIGGRVVGAVGSLGKVLWNAGASIIKGLIDGIGSMVSSLASKLKGITKMIPKWKGPHDKDKKLLTPAGVAIMEGLIRGIESRRHRLKEVLGKVTAFVAAQGAKLADLMGKRQETIDSLKGFASSAFSQDLSNQDTGAAPTAASLLEFSKGELAKALQLKSDVSNLVSKGLSKALIQQLVSSGASGEAQIHALAQGSKADVTALNALDKATQAALASAGATAANALYGADIKKAQDAERVAKAIRAELEKWRKQEDKNTIVEIRLDGRIIRMSLLELKRKSKQPLGLS